MAFLLRLALLCLSIPLAGCATKTVVALLPDATGKVGAISVTSGAGSVDISSPYQSTTIAAPDAAPTAPKEVGRRELLETFADALSVQPPLPLHFYFYFSRETTPTFESLEKLPSILAAVRERNSGFVSVVGHADTTGPGEYNIDVTLRRALVVRDLLVDGGVAAVTIYPTWEGEENLVVPTPDEVRELRNRTVEVIVR